METQEPHIERREETREQRLERLEREHADLDRRVREIEGHLHLSAEEQAEEHRLKKLKLLKKDQILLLKKSS